MGFFSKKEEKEKDSIPGIPDLPPLPAVHDLEEQSEELPKLPSFPKNDLGEKFSQDTIKKAINGKKEGEEEILTEDDSAKENWQMIRESPKTSFSYPEPDESLNEKFSEGLEDIKRKIPDYKYSRRMLGKGIPEGFEEAGRRIREAEPIFVRIDKFEESRKILEKTKSQIFEIEKVLSRIKLVKQEEDRELIFWEQEISNIKDKISNVEEDLFSKL